METTFLPPTTKRCESCGSDFFCGAASQSCWCQGHCVSATELKTLADTYRDCLCPQCLAEVTEKPLEPAQQALI